MGAAEPAFRLNMLRGFLVFGGAGFIMTGGGDSRPDWALAGVWGVDGESMPEDVGLESRAEFSNFVLADSAA